MFPCRNCFTVLLVLTVSFGSARAEPLSFNAALDLAERLSPELAADQARVEAARATAIAADALPDPRLTLGVANVPITGIDRGRLDREPMTMQMIGLMQEVPNSAKRAAREAVAEAGADLAAAQRRVTSQQVQRDTALAWLDLYYLQRRLALFDRLDVENRTLDAAVKARVAGGGAVAEAVMPRQEALRLADRRDDLVRDIAKARAVLRRFVGAAADAPLAGEPPPLIIDAGHMRHQLEVHPEFVAYAAASDKAAAEVREASAMKTPDWGVELAYQKRERFSDMVSLQFRFDLPFFAATRQDPIIAARHQEALRIESEREALLRRHTQELEEGLADHAALMRRLERAETEVLPLVQEKVLLLDAAYRGGSAELAALLAARAEAVEQQLVIIDLRARRAAVAARLRFAYEIPQSCRPQGGRPPEGDKKTRGGSSFSCEETQP